MQQRRTSQYVPTQNSDSQVHWPTKFSSLIKKHSDYGRPIQGEVSFTRREIGRLIGRKEWGGRDSEQLSRALHEIHYTFIKTHFRNSDGRYVEHSFNVFPEILLERREFASDPIEACTITLAEPIIAFLRDEHFTCLNFSLMQGLGTIGQAIYMRMFFHFANLYDGRGRTRLAFPKRYDDICREWLDGLTILDRKSKIIGEQLGPHLDQLVAAAFLSSYNVAKARSAEGFIVTFRPGAAFFEDYERFYRRRQQGELQWQFDGDRREIGEPLKVARLFAEKRAGISIGPLAFVPTKDVETAKQLLSAIAFNEIPSFLDYALAEARKANFDVQTLGGLRQYMAAYETWKQRQAGESARAAARKVEEREDAERLAYDRFRRAEAGKLLAGLPDSEKTAIEAEARSFANRFDEPLRGSMVEFGRSRFTIERHGQRLMSFDQWKSDRVQPRE